MHAIRKVAGVRLPMVIEAPLRVLDPEHREAVLREMLSKCPGQMLLLLTPDEMPQQSAYHIRTRVAQRFTLTRVGESEETEVRDSAWVTYE